MGWEGGINGEAGGREARAEGINGEGSGREGLMGREGKWGGRREGKWVGGRDKWGGRRAGGINEGGGG